MTLFWVFVVISVAFGVYASYTQFSNTPTTDSIPRRLWKTAAAAAIAIGAAAVAAIHGMTAP